MLHLASIWFSLVQAMDTAPDRTVWKVLVTQSVGPAAFNALFVVNETDAADVGERTDEFSQFIL